MSKVRKNHPIPDLAESRLSHQVPQPGKENNSCPLLPPKFST